MNLTKLIAKILALLPVSAYARLRRWLEGRNRAWLVGRCDLYRLAQGGFSAPATFTKVYHIRKGLYDYEYFNICFVNNMLSLCIEALAQGMIPRIEVINSAGDNIWERYYDQPFSHIDITGMDQVECQLTNGKAFPDFMEVYDADSIRMWGSAYETFAVAKPEVRDYVEEEIRSIFSAGEFPERTLGVLVRGTDYTSTKPAGHPVQPDLDDIIADVRARMDAGAYDAIYLATEDGKVDAAFRQAFGERISINKRQYYDELFDEGQLSLIKDVHFDREDDEYLKGLEYLSSMMILSRCQSLMAGNCGGSQTAVFLNAGAYKECKVYDLGVY